MLSRLMVQNVVSWYICICMYVIIKYIKNIIYIYIIYLISIYIYIYIFMSILIFVLIK